MVTIGCVRTLAHFGPELNLFDCSSKSSYLLVQAVIVPLNRKITLFHPDTLQQAQRLSHFSPQKTEYAKLPPVLEAGVKTVISAGEQCPISERKPLKPLKVLANLSIDNNVSAAEAQPDSPTPWAVPAAVVLIAAVQSATYVIMITVLLQNYKCYQHIVNRHEILFFLWPVKKVNRWIWIPRLEKKKTSMLCPMLVVIVIFHLGHCLGEQTLPRVPKMWSCLLFLYDGLHNPIRAVS